MPSPLPAGPVTRWHGSCVGMHLDSATPDLNLLAGQLYFGHRAKRVRTLLGSCVSVTLWSPERRLGGMCHFLLPSRTRSSHEPMDGRFGEEAMHALMQAIARAGARPSEFQAHLFGGADTMPDREDCKFNVGERNIELGWSLIDRHGFELVNVDVGDHVPRTVHLDLGTGSVDMRRGASVKRGN